MERQREMPGRELTGARAVSTMQRIPDVLSRKIAHDAGEKRRGTDAVLIRHGQALWRCALVLSLLASCLCVTPGAQAATGATPASEQERIAVIAGLQAQHQAALIRERRLADDGQQRLIADAQARMLGLRRQLDRARQDAGSAQQALGDLTEQLNQARADFARRVAEVSAREGRLHTELAAYRVELQGLVNRASPEKLVALQRFADGDRVGAWPVIKDITDATRRARDLAAARANAADQRELARLRNIMRDNGEATTQDVLALWDEAAALDDSDFWTQIERGRLAQILGNLQRAVAAFRQGEQAAKTDRDRSVVLNDLADVLVAQGDLAGARQRYERSLQIVERLAKEDPNAASLRRDVSIGLNGVGNVLAAQGDLGGARRRYEQSLEISERLAQEDPSSASLRRDLSVCLDRLGDVLVHQGDLAGARRRFEQSLQIREQLAKEAPSSASLRRDVSVSLEKVGEVLEAQGSLAEARQRYEQTLQIVERLALEDPSSATLQRDVSVSLKNVGDVLVAQGDLAAARQRYEQSLQIFERLSKEDPSSASLRRDVSIGLEGIGNVLMAQGDLVGARQRFEQSLQIAERLTKEDPSSARQRRELSVSLLRVGNVLVAQGDQAAARQRYEQSVHISEGLAKEDPSSATLRRDVWVGHWRLARLDNSRSAWKRVVQALEAMRADGVLSPSDVRFIELARTNATAAKQP
jgi:tetratricopeptide (TPR) repeat protein